MNKKQYSGYKSFQYLDPGSDFRAFKLAREIGRVEPFVYPVSEDQERRVRQLLAENVPVLPGSRSLGISGSVWGGIGGGVCSHIGEQRLAPSPGKPVRGHA